MTTAEIETSQKIFAEHLTPLVVEDHVKPYLSEAEEWLLSDAPEVRDYLLGLPAGRLAKAFGPAYIRMKEFPHLYPNGIVLDSMGFKSKTFTTVPLMMETGTDEFSIYAAQDPYFAPYVADRSILTNEKMRKEFEFAKKYGSAMYRLFNADAPASMLVGKYRAPIYTLTIDYGDDPKIVGDAAALLLGSVHGIWIPCVTGRATSTTADFSIHAFDNPGFQDMKRMIQQYIGNFMRTGIRLRPDRSQRMKRMRMSSVRLRRMIRSIRKRRISSSIMSSPDAGGAVRSTVISHIRKIDSEPNRRRLEDRKKDSMILLRRV